MNPEALARIVDMIDVGRVVIEEVDGKLVITLEQKK